MQWFLELETEKDPISICRLMNIFRRKGVNIVALSLEAGPAEFSMKALVETAEFEVAHIFNFLRRTEGVRHVTCYRHESAADVSVTAKDGSEGITSRAARLPEYDSSLIIHTSRATNGESGVINVKKRRAPVETMTVN